MTLDDGRVDASVRRFRAVAWRLRCDVAVGAISEDLDAHLSTACGDVGKYGNGEVNERKRESERVGASEGDAGDKHSPEALRTPDSCVPQG